MDVRALLSCPVLYPPIIERLPIVDMSSDTSAWLSYLRRVYPHRNDTVDLNTFTFFYWDAPINVTLLHYCDWHDERGRVEDGTPWIGGPEAWEWGPEHMMRQVGFFVFRARSPGAVRSYFESNSLEVLRYGPNARLVSLNDESDHTAWFYHCIGSGIYVDTSLVKLEDVLYFEYHSAPREEILIQHDASGFWPPGLQFHTYGGGPCSFKGKWATVLNCEEQNTRIISPSIQLCAAHTHSFVKDVVIASFTVAVLLLGLCACRHCHCLLARHTAHHTELGGDLPPQARAVGPERVDARGSTRGIPLA